MSVLFLLLAVSLVMALMFLGLFIKSVKQGQYDDIWSPARRMLVDDEVTKGNGRSGVSIPAAGRDRHPAGPR
jgi:cbb3-type cytochrome oxidase maturation protein